MRPTTAAKAAWPQNVPKNCSGSRPSICGVRVTTGEPGTTTVVAADSPPALTVSAISSLGSAEVTYSRRHVRESSAAIDV